MDLGTALLLVVAALLGINHMLLRLPGWEYRTGLFWSVQFINLTAVILLLAVGLPGFGDASVAVNWVLGLLFILHIVTNNGRLVAARQANSGMADGDKQEKRDQMMAALNKSRSVEE